AGTVSGLHVPVVGPLPNGVSSTITYAAMPEAVGVFTFDAAKAAAAAAKAGKTLPTMPSGMDGSKLTVTVGPALVEIFGNLNAGAAENATQLNLPQLIVGASSSPVVTSTGVTAQELENYLLSQPGVSPKLASAIRSIKDPSTTLPIPIPIELATSKDVQVQGVNGLALGDNTGLGAAVIWIKSGTVYGVAGTVKQSEILDVANHLHQPALVAEVAEKISTAAAPDGAAAGSPAIHTVELSKRFGKTVALAGLSMTVPRGEVFGFLGPNGAGKTTSVKLLLGLIAPSSGEGWLLGRPIGDLETRRKIGYLPELFRYQGWLSANEVLALHCELAPLPRSSWEDEIKTALDTVGLTDRARDRVGTFSK